MCVCVCVCWKGWCWKPSTPLTSCQASRNSQNGSEVWPLISSSFWFPFFKKKTQFPTCAASHDRFQAKAKQCTFLSFDSFWCCAVVYRNDCWKVDSDLIKILSYLPAFGMNRWSWGPMVLWPQLYPSSNKKDVLQQNVLANGRAVSNALHHSFVPENWCARKTVTISRFFFMLFYTFIELHKYMWPSRSGERGRL